MKRMLAALAAAAALMLSACAGPASPSPSGSPAPASSPATGSPSVPAGAEELGVGDFFPFKRDVHMVYRGSGNEYAGFESFVEYLNNGAMQQRLSNAGTDSVGVYIIRDGELLKVFWQGETYYRHDFTAERTMEEVVIKEPIAAGTAWKLPDGSDRSITATDMNVTVPYGTFKAVEVTTTTDGGTLKEYYAAGIGLIKREYVPAESPSAPVTSELERFEEGSPLSQNARFFYPDFSGGQIKYVEKKIEFFTGDDVEDKFEEEFKRVPDGSGLTPVLSEGASVRSVAFDPSSGVVTVDFSKEFITGMNAGAALEGLILQSVADTLGTYFQTDKVQITIEGGRYESGHFLFGRGDFLPFDPDGAEPYKA